MIMCSKLLLCTLHFTLFGDMAMTSVCSCICLMLTLDWISAPSLRSVSRKALFFGSSVAHLCTSLKAISSFPSFSRAWQRRYKAFMSFASTSIAMDEGKLFKLMTSFHLWIFVLLLTEYLQLFKVLKVLLYL